MDTMKFLGITDGLIQFHKLRLEFGQGNATNEDYVNDLIKLFKLDHELHPYELPEHSPHFLEVVKFLDTMDHSTSENTYDFYLDLVNVLLKLDITDGESIPDLLDKFRPGKKHPKFSILRHSKLILDFHFQIGDYETCIEEGKRSYKFTERNYIEVRHDNPERWKPFMIMGDSYAALEDYDMAIKCYHKSFTWTGIVSQDYFTMADRLTKCLFFHGDLTKAQKICNDASCDAFLKFKDEQCKFDLRKAQCYRKIGEFQKVLDLLAESESDKFHLSIKYHGYYHLLKGICAYKISNDIHDVDLELYCMVHYLETFKDIVKFLEESSDMFDFFQEDRLTFISRVPNVWRQLHERPMTLQMTEKLALLKHSLVISSYLNKALNLPMKFSAVKYEYVHSDL